MINKDLSGEQYIHVNAATYDTREHIDGMRSMPHRQRYLLLMVRAKLSAALLAESRAEAQTQEGGPTISPSKILAVHNHAEQELKEFINIYPPSLTTAQSVESYIQAKLQ